MFKSGDVFICLVEQYLIDCTFFIWVNIPTKVLWAYLCHFFASRTSTLLQNFNVVEKDSMDPSTVRPIDVGVLRQKNIVLILGLLANFQQNPCMHAPLTVENTFVAIRHLVKLPSPQSPQASYLCHALYATSLQLN